MLCNFTEDIRNNCISLMDFCCTAMHFYHLTFHNKTNMLHTMPLMLHAIDTFFMMRNIILSARPSPTAREKNIIRRSETIQQALQQRGLLLTQHLQQCLLADIILHCSSCSATTMQKKGKSILRILYSGYDTYFKMIT